MIPIALVRSIYVIAVGEHRSKVALALSANIMVIIMVIRTTIKRNIFCGTPRNIISAVSLNSLYLSQTNPQPERNHVTRSHSGPKKRRYPKYQNLRPVGIRRRKPNGRRVFMVNLMNLLVPPLAMKKPVDPIVCIVLNDKINHQLGNNLP